MRLAPILLLIAAVGCGPTYVEPPRGDFTPALSAAIGMTITGVTPAPGPAPPTPPTPGPNPKPDSIECPNCNGTGKVGDGRTMLDCPVCDGTGKIKSLDVAWQRAARAMARSIANLTELRAKEAEREKSIGTLNASLAEANHRAVVADKAVEAQRLLFDGLKAEHDELAKRISALEKPEPESKALSIKEINALVKQAQIEAGGQPKREIIRDQVPVYYEPPMRYSQPMMMGGGCSGGNCSGGNCGGGGGMGFW